MPKSFEEEFEVIKQKSVAQLLMKAARLLNEKAVTRVQAKGVPSFRVSHTALFPHISFAGTRSTEIAKKLGITKQAVGQLVADLEEMGVVERAPDPTDKRAQLVRFTAFGQRALLDGMNVLTELEHEVSAQIGADRMTAMQEGLIILVQALESAASEK